MKHKVKSHMPPTVITTLSGTFAVFGGNWIPVPADTTLEEVTKWWEPVRFVKKAMPTADKSFKVKGSKGDVYVVSVQNNVWNCTCSGFGFRRKCRHIDSVKK